MNAEPRETEKTEAHLMQAQEVAEVDQLVAGRNDDVVEQDPNERSSADLR